MALGSPVHSPVGMGAPPSFSTASPAFHHHHSSSFGGAASTPTGGQGVHPHGFLPGYLLGDYSQQGSGGRMVSPSKVNRSVNQATSTPSNPARNPNGFLTPTTPAGHMRTPSEKPGGPPITGLYSNTPKKNHLAFGTPNKFGTPVNTTPQLSFGSSSVVNNSELLAPADSGSCSGGTTWITVFGFPPSAASYVLSQFSQCGTILQHHIPSNGNWMNIRFQTKMQAQKAIGRSGRVFGGSLMVGVMPCHDPPPPVADGNISTLDHTGHYHNATGAAADTSNVMTLNSSLATPGHNRSIRPLTQSYKNAHNENDVSLIANTPNKSTGIVSKAMEYVFGW